MRFVPLDEENYRGFLTKYLEVCTEFIVVYPANETEEDYVRHNPLIAHKTCPHAKLYQGSGIKP